MTALAAWWLLVYGITLVLTGSKLLEPLQRRLGHFGRCPMCVGFWVGGILAALDPNFGPLYAVSWPRAAQAIGSAFCASGACWVTHVLLVKLGAEDL